MKTVIGLFTEQADADHALAELEAAGFKREEVSILAHRETVADIVDDERGESAVESAGVGALGGTALGGLVGLIAGASALMIPGIGPALAAGAWATVLGTTAAGAGIGAAYGGLVGALIGFGVAEEQTHIYVEGIQNGGILVLVQPDKQERVAMVEKIMVEQDGIGVDIISEPEKI
jgi:uncharacterized membrane protein